MAGYDARPDREWISYPHAAKLLDVSVATMREMARRGALSVRKLPASQPRLNRAEVMALAQASTTPAKNPL